VTFALIFDLRNQALEQRGMLTAENIKTLEEVKEKQEM
jgi:hypothetical protein